MGTTGTNRAGAPTRRLHFFVRHNKNR